MCAPGEMGGVRKLWHSVAYGDWNKLFYIGSGAIRQGGNLERPQREPVCRKDESDIALEKPELCCCIVVLRRTVLLTFPSPCRFS